MIVTLMDVSFDSRFFHSAGLILQPKPPDEGSTRLVLLVYLTCGITSYAPASQGRLPLQRYSLWGENDRETIELYLDLLGVFGAEIPTRDALRRELHKLHGV